MPHEQVEFAEFPSRDKTLWKYMDLPKFVSVLDKESLYFVQVQRFDDPFEGSVPQENLNYRKYRKGSDRHKEPIGQYRNLLNEELTRYTYADCWHMNEVESAAMWDLYTTRGYGIAITTTVEQYLNEVCKYASTVHVGAVNYINYQDGSLPRYDTLASSFHKRTSFAHENEFRGIIQYLPYYLKAAEYHCDDELLKSDIEEFSHNQESGISVPAATDDLIDNIYVAPETPPWRRSVVETIVESFSELERDDVRQSSLEEDPVY